MRCAVQYSITVLLNMSYIRLLLVPPRYGFSVSGRRTAHPVFDALHARCHSRRSSAHEGIRFPEAEDRKFFIID